MEAVRMSPAAHPKRKVHVVRSAIPFGTVLNPYINRFPFVSGIMYARMQAALDMTRATFTSRALEIGCWAGYFLPSLQREFQEVWGIDDDSASVVEAVPDCWTVLQIADDVCRREAGAHERARLVKATGAALPFPDAYFDVVFCLDTIVHVAQRFRGPVVCELRRVTRRNGELIFSLPVETGPIAILKSSIRALSGKHCDTTSTTYDYRSDLTLLRSLFQVCETTFVPLKAFPWLSPFVVVRCET
jgi:SAM-dependent methyltransferase